MVLPLVFALVQFPPLIHAHAHNDYQQKRPLVGAMEQRFCSFEADTYPVNGKLWIGHDRKDLTPSRTLENMYLRPMFRQIARHGGHLYRERTPIILLVEFKQDGEKAYPILKRELAPYRRYLTSLNNGKITKRGVTVIITGNRPSSMLAVEKQRFAFIDGDPENMNPPANAKLFPLISTDFTDHFKNGALLTDADRATISGMARQAHRNGQMLRFWATPDDESLWTTLCEAGVDLIGTDDQPRLGKFLRSRLGDGG